MAQKLLDCLHHGNSFRWCRGKFFTFTLLKWCKHLSIAKLQNPTVKGCEETGSEMSVPLLLAGLVTVAFNNLFFKTK